MAKKLTANNQAETATNKVFITNIFKTDRNPYS